MRGQESKCSWGSSHSALGGLARPSFSTSTTIGGAPRDIHLNLLTRMRAAKWQGTHDLHTYVVHTIRHSWGPTPPTGWALSFLIWRSGLSQLPSCGWQSGPFPGGCILSTPGNSWPRIPAQKQLWKKLPQLSWLKSASGMAATLPRPNLRSDPRYETPA